MHVEQITVLTEEIGKNECLLNVEKVLAYI